MNNQSILSERVVKNLLHSLNADKKPYPPGLLDARRAAYLSQVISVVNSGPRSGKGSKGQGRGQGGASHAAGSMTPVMKAVLTVLIAGNIVLVTYLGVLAYENWDKVQALLLGAPIASETSPASLELSTQPPAPNSTPEIATAPESTVVPGSTPEPGTSQEEPQSAEGGSGNQPEVSTPEPPAENKPGLHLGQTPHPQNEPPGQDKKNDQNPDNSNDQGNNKK